MGAVPQLCVGSVSACGWVGSVCSAGRSQRVLKRRHAGSWKILAPHPTPAFPRPPGPGLTAILPTPPTSRAAGRRRAPWPRGMETASGPSIGWLSPLPTRWVLESHRAPNAVGN